MCGKIRQNLPLHPLFSEKKGQRRPFLQNRENPLSKLAKSLFFWPM
jgi:hypothetical protein